MTATTDYTTWLQSLKAGDVIPQVEYPAFAKNPRTWYLAVVKVTATQIKTAHTSYDRRTGFERGRKRVCKRQIQMPANA